jgi:hypothetical protein
MVNGEFLVGNPHEFDCWLNIDGGDLGHDPLAPWFACSRLTNDGDLEIDLGPVEGDDDELKVMLSELRYR